MSAPRRLDPDRLVKHLPRLYRAARAGAVSGRKQSLLALTTIGSPHTIASLGWIEEVIEAAK
jgi:hypothetical protein